MFRSIEVENCYSFLERTELSFVVNNKAPKGNRYLKSCVEGERLTKIIAILGHNGSGKSSLLKVVSFLKWFIVESFGEKPDEDINLQPFLLKERPFSPSKIKVEFECNNAVFRYLLEINKSMVLVEELEKLDLGEKSDALRKRFKKLFSRIYNEKTKSYQLKAASEFKMKKGIRELVEERENASLISAGTFINHAICVELKKYWSTVTTKIKNTGFRPFPPEYLLIKSTEFYYRNQQFKTKMESMMLRSDLGVVGIDIDKVKLSSPNEIDSKGQEFYMPYGRHKGLKGKEYRLPFSCESGGTQQIYILLSSLFPALENGGLAVIDELEADLHPEVLPVIFDLFESSKTNPKGAQLIFTCHATTLFEILHKYQMVIVDKDGEGKSTAKRVDSMSVRSDDNLFAKYWSGHLGGLHRLR